MSTPTPFVITIGRQLGSGGQELAQLLSELLLSVPVYDKEILGLAAQEVGLSKRVFERSDERKSFLRNFLHVVQPFVGGGGDFYNFQLSDENIFKLQSGVIQRVASTNSCIFIGRAADYILRNHPRHCSIFCCAPQADRAARLASKLNISEKRALDLIEESDERRSTYYNFYSTGTWGMADTYDLCVNTSALPLPELAQQVAHFVREKLHISLLEETLQPTAPADPQP